MVDCVLVYNGGQSRTSSSMTRAAVSKTGGCGFESHLVHQHQERTMTNNKNDDIMLPSTYTSRTITRSGIVKEGRELVVACGYAQSGAFGYFVCWEQQAPQGDNKVLYEYSSPISFNKKENERTLHQVLASFRSYIDSYKNQ